MLTFITVIHVITCVLLVLVVLLQSGKGAEISASFGGSSQTVFGSSGGENFFTRFTEVAALIFFATSLILTVLGNQSRKSRFETGALPATNPPISAPAPVKMAPGAPAAAPQPATAPKNVEAQEQKK